MIVIPGLYNKSVRHTTDSSPYYNYGMWKHMLTGGTLLTVIGIIGIILFVLAFISTMCGIILRKGGKVVSKKLTITSLVTLFVTTLVFIMIIISKPDGPHPPVSLIWGDYKPDGYTEILSFSIYGWSVLVIAILGGIGIVGSFVPLCFKKHNSLAK